MLGVNCSNQSTNSVPGAHLLTNLPETFLSLKQLLVVSSSVRKAHPMRPIAWLGASVIGSAGFGLSGLIDLRPGGEPGPCNGEDFELTPGPKPARYSKVYLPALT